MEGSGEEKEDKAKKESIIENKHIKKTSGILVHRRGTVDDKKIYITGKHNEKKRTFNARETRK